MSVKKKIRQKILTLSFASDTQVLQTVRLYALVCCPHDNNNCALTDSFTFCAKKYYDIKYKLQTQFSCCFTVAAEYNLELSFC